MNADELKSLLRSRGFEKCADGSWGKEGPASGGAQAGPNAEHPAKQPLEAEREGGKGDARVPCKIIAIVTIYTTSLRDSDGLGAATKGVFDALVEQGELDIPDDSPEYLEVVFDQIKVKTRKEHKMLIEAWISPQAE